MKIRLSRIGIALLLGAGIASAQTADDVIAKYVAGRGGIDKLKAIHSVVMTIKMNQQGLEFPGKLEVKRPDSCRMEMTVQGKTMVQAYDGKSAWQIMPFLGPSAADPQLMDADDAKEIIEQADLIEGPMVDYKAKGNTVEYLGEEDVEGSPAYKLKVTLKDGNVNYVYIDKDTGLEVKETSKRKQKASEIEIDSYFSNYQPVDGVLFPYSIQNKVHGKDAGQITIDSIQANVPIEDSVFAMPAPAAKPAVKPQAPEKEKK